MQMLIFIILLKLLHKYFLWYLFLNGCYVFVTLILTISYFLNVIKFNNFVFSPIHIILSLLFYNRIFRQTYFFYKPIWTWVSLIPLFFGFFWAYFLFKMFFLWDVIELLALVLFIGSLLKTHINYNKSLLICVCYCLSLKIFHLSLLSPSLHKFSVLSLFSHHSLCTVTQLTSLIFFFIYSKNAYWSQTANPSINLKVSTLKLHLIVVGILI